VALGDSYTIGTGLRFPRDRWPNQLMRALRNDLPIEIGANLAVRSASTIDVIERQLPALTELEPQFVTLLIGVNDVIGAGRVTAQSADQRFRAAAEAYRRNLNTIFDAILERVPPNRVIAITTPDFTLTPRGGDFVDPPQDGAAIARQRAEIKRFNALLRAAATSRGIAVVDISPVSDRVPEDPSLLTEDEVHPSAKQYAGWVELIAPRVRRLLGAAPQGGAAG
jgi:lysophospholipase L1-like esterase